MKVIALLDDYMQHSKDAVFTIEHMAGDNSDLDPYFVNMVINDLKEVNTRAESVAIELQNLRFKGLCDLKGKKKDG